MKLYLKSEYESLSDRELIDWTVSGNEEAMLYLIYDRHFDMISFYTWRFFGSLEYLDDLANSIYILLKGSNADWKPLKSFQGKSTFKTWFKSVIVRFFLKKRKELKGIGDHATSIEEIGEGNACLQYGVPSENQKMVMLMEAINRLKNDEYRFILIKELEGYNHQEIAEMLTEKRRIEKRENIKNNKKIVELEARHVDLSKARALPKVKANVEQIKKEWYGNN